MSQKIKKAFSLLELSVVILIISILVVGSTSYLSGNLNSAKNDVTKERLKEIYKAMGTYLANNKRLPCPASMLLTKASANYGVEVPCFDQNTTSATGRGIWRSTWNPNVLYGMVPVKTLGLTTDMAEDAFGTVIAYSMLRGYANSDAFKNNNDASTYTANGAGVTAYDDGQAGSSASDPNRIRIYERLGTSINRISTNVMMVLISYGQNKNMSNKYSNTNLQFSDEGLNGIYGDSSSFQNPTGYFYNFGNCGSGCFNYAYMARSDSNETFDDILLYKTRDQMLLDFNLTSIAECPAGNITIDSISTAFPVGKYGEIIQSSTTCAKYTSNGLVPKYVTIRCGLFGIWGDVLDHCSP